MTAICFSLFNVEPYRLEMLEFVIRQLRKQTAKSHIALGVLNIAEKLSPTLLNSLDQLILLKGEKNLFQKEAILNAVTKQLPSSINNLIFLDSDIFPLDLDWVERVNNLLKREKIVQGYSLLFYLTQKTTQKLLKNRRKDWKWDELVDMGSLVYNDRPSHTKDVAVVYPSFAFTSPVTSRMHGASGGCLAFQRSYFEQLGGFPYEEVFGGVNDILLFHKLGLPTRWDPTLFAESIRGKYFGAPSTTPFKFVPRRLLHLFHKSGKDRNYYQRVELSRELDYDPVTDIFLNPSGGIELTERGKRLEASFSRIAEKTLKPDTAWYEN